MFINDNVFKISSHDNEFSFYFFHVEICLYFSIFIFLWLYKHFLSLSLSFSLSLSLSLFLYLFLSLNNEGVFISIIGFTWGGHFSLYNRWPRKKYIKKSLPEYSTMYVQEFIFRSSVNRTLCDLMGFAKGNYVNAAVKAV